VWFALESKVASEELAVAPVAIPSSFVFDEDAAHHAAIAWKILCGVNARRLVEVPVSASDWLAVEADHSREFVRRESDEPTASVIP